MIKSTILNWFKSTKDPLGWSTRKRGVILRTSRASVASLKVKET